MFGWLPKRTVNSMKSMLEHSEDRYSPSLHIVDERSASLFHECSGAMAKGVGMQPSEKRSNKNKNTKNKSNKSKVLRDNFTPQHVARIRALRRAAVRRRRILVFSLVFLTLVVLVAGLSGLYSAWFALIPFAMVSTVLYFGSIAAKHARDWEARVAAYNKSAGVPQNYGQKSYGESGESIVEPVFDAIVNSVVTHEEEYQNYSSGSVTQYSSNTQDNTETSVMQQREISMALERVNSQNANDYIAAGNQSSSLPDVSDSSDSSKSHQDLISFSFGSDSTESSSNDKNNGPLSLEIKSTKQVAKAISAKEPLSTKESSNNNVEPPVSTEDSLGKADLRDVLARRAA
ncbi:hypothetical protein CGSMWGv55152_05484 [Gardnerella vaginalis 55152]|uniref:Uncharacterized protein n=1 Tax=Gardnerella vaginalis 55152 TaxID=698955 RepID=I4LRI5_GARVA|nr:hypothetical protein [Gardnerella vaginalis]EIK79575.1 hypothetical protein CGSMWGv55152_05484 [Gardnerella vaginalis 55152]